MTKKALCRLLPVYFFFLLPCFGQTQISSADLKGRITDPSDSVIVGAAVYARNLSTNATRMALTGDLGNFGIYLLPPGEYEITAEAMGFQRQVRRITLTVGQIGILNLELRPGAQSIQVEVTDENLPLLESARTNPAATLTQHVIDGLPINGRNFLSFTLLSSGVVEESAAVTNSLLPQLPTSRLIFAGQNGRSNSITIDGVDNNDIAGNGVRPTISQEAVQEFQINHHTYNAEFGRSSGGVINIVSKSGTNRLRGSVYDYFRHEKLDARNAFATSLKDKPPFKRNQPGFTLGGPIKRDRTFFFASYEGLFRRESAATAILSDPSILQPTTGQRDLINTLAGSASADWRDLGRTLDQLLTTSANSPYPFSGAPFPMNRTTFQLLTSGSGSHPIRQTTSTGTFRLDDIRTSKDQLLFRYNLTNDSQHGIGIGGLTSPSAGFDIAIRDHAFVFGENHVSSKTINEFRFQFVREVFNVNTTDPYGPRIAIPGVGNFGRELIDPSDRTQHRYQWLDNFSYTRGKHYFKMGVDFNRYSFNTYSPVFTGGEIDFARLQIPLGAVLGPAATPLVSALGQSKTSGGLDRVDLIPIVTTEPLTIVQQVNFGFAFLFNQGFGDPNALLKGQMLGFYWQDSAQVTRSLHLDFGVRYDYEMQPEGVHRDPNNIAPRFGMAYVPSKNGKTVIRAGAGVYFQPLYTATAFSAKILGKNQQISNILVSPSPDLTPVSSGSTCGIALASAGIPPSFCFFQQLVASNVLTFPATRTIPESAYQQLLGLTRQTSTNKLAVRLEDDARDTYSIQSSLGIDRQLGHDWSLSANYLFTRALRLIRVRQANALPNPDLLDPFGRPTLTRRANPSLLADYVVETAGNSVYHGMTLDLRKRFSRNYEFIGSYTLGKAIDDTIDIQIPQGPQDPTNTRAEKSLSAFDTRHRLSVTTILDSPWKSRWLSGFSVAPILTVRSAFPFNITTGLDTNQDGNVNDRPFLVGRNTGRGGNYFTVDLRVARKITVKERASMQLMVDAFNIFNRVNFKEVNGDTGGALRLSDLGLTDARVKASGAIPPSRLGGFTAAHDPRIVQVGLKVSF